MQNSPYATANAINVACGKTKFRSTGSMNGYTPPSKNLLIQNWNPPPSVNCVPNTLYSPKITKNTPTPMRSAARARALLFSCAAKVIANAHDTTECVQLREYRSRQPVHSAAPADATLRAAPELR